MLNVFVALAAVILLGLWVYELVQHGHSKRELGIEKNKHTITSNYMFAKKGALEEEVKNHNLTKQRLALAEADVQKLADLVNEAMAIAATSKPAKVVAEPEKVVKKAKAPAKKKAVAKQKPKVLKKAKK